MGVDAGKFNELLKYIARENGIAETYHEVECYVAGGGLFPDGLDGLKNPHQRIPGSQMANAAPKLTVQILFPTRTSGRAWPGTSGRGVGGTRERRPS